MLCYVTMYDDDDGDVSAIDLVSLSIDYMSSGNASWTLR